MRQSVAARKNRAPALCYLQGRVALVSLFLLTSNPLYAASIVALGDLPGGDFYSTASGVSADGSVVVGTGNSADGWQAFRWTRAGGMVGLPGAGPDSSASAVSADGSVVVGTGHFGGAERAFRWTGATGVVNLGLLPGSNRSRGFAVSGDGSVVGGNSESLNGHEAFRWTESGGMVGLGDLPGGGMGSAVFGISHDGSVMVGGSDSTMGIEAFRWTADGGMVALGSVPGEAPGGLAFDVSADGTVVVGSSSSKPFRWTSEEGPVGLGPEGSASSVSDDGNVVVGTVGDSANAFVWTPDTGIRSLWDVLLSLGVSPGDDGWAFFNAAADVSGDGRYIVGWGWRNDKTEAFLVDLQGTGDDDPVISQLEIPADGSDQAGVGIVSGWHCTAAMIEVQFDDLPRLTAGSHTTRNDTAGICGDADNGFSLLWAYSLLGEGEHTAVLYADGEEFARATFNVTLVNGEEFVTGASGAWTIDNFPVPGNRLKVRWDEPSQNLVIFGSEPMD